MYAEPAAWLAAYGKHPHGGRLQFQLEITREERYEIGWGSTQTTRSARNFPKNTAWLPMFAPTSTKTPSLRAVDGEVLE